MISYMGQSGRFDAACRVKTWSYLAAHAEGAVARGEGTAPRAFRMATMES
jgi:hypothetical protein